MQVIGIVAVWLVFCCFLGFTRLAYGVTSGTYHMRVKYFVYGRGRYVCVCVVCYLSVHSSIHLSVCLRTRTHARARTRAHTHTHTGEAEGVHYTPEQAVSGCNGFDDGLQQRARGILVSASLCMHVILSVCARARDLRPRTHARAWARARSPGHACTDGRLHTGSSAKGRRTCDLSRRD